MGFLNVSGFLGNIREREEGEGKGLVRLVRVRFEYGNQWKVRNNYVRKLRTKKPWELPWGIGVHFLSLNILAFSDRLVFVFSLNFFRN